MTAHRGRLALLAIVLILPGCATLGDKGQPLVPTRYQTRTGPFVVFTNFPLPADAPMIHELHALEGEFAETLGANVTKIEPPIEVYLLADRKSFEHFLTFYYPELPQRRAFFLGQGDRRVIYTYQSDRLEIDVRHEATHALLSASFGDLPLWLDEGLAEYFETPGEAGNNPENLGRMPGDLAEGWKPDLPRLERMRLIKEMSPRDYRESWAWVHLLLTGPEEERQKLRDYLTRLGREDADRPASLASELGERIPDADARLVGHVKRMKDAPIARSVPVSKPSASPADPTFRLQGASIEPLARGGKARPRRGFFGKMKDFLVGPAEPTDL